LAAISNSIITVSMLFLSKSRISLVGFVFLALGGCTEQGPDRAVWQAAKDAASAVGNFFGDDKPKPAAVDAPDPGDTPFPNLAVVPRRPARPDAQVLQTEQAQLADQRQAAQNFDSQLRAIDPVLNPASRPPEPPPVAAALAPSGATPIAAAPALPAPVASMPVPAPAPYPLPVPPAPAVAAPPPSQVQAPPAAAQAAPLPPFVPPVLAPVTVPAPVPENRPPAARPVAPAARPAPSTLWLVGEVSFADGSTLLNADSRRTLRAAVVAANEQGRSVRITPIVEGLAGPQDGALAPRRMAALVGELEALGLQRSRVRIEAGGFRRASIAVEF
jgi:hypothetical protein